MPFSKLNLSSPILKAISKSDFIEPTEIQKSVIPLVFDKKDVMAKAQTGTGKSASFILPTLQMLDKTRTEGKAKIKVLVITPTKELTIQISKAYEKFGEFLKVKPKVVSVIGGESLGDQIYKIQQGCDIVVATSGRFLDVLSKKQTNLSNLEFFILDEADKMLNLGFSEELELILKEIPTNRQNLMFSATYPDKILEIASKITKNPIKVFNENTQPIVETIKQRVISVNKENRSPLLRHLIKEEKLEQVLVFMANKRATDNIAHKFRKYGFLAESFHGDLDTPERTRTLDAFKDKKIKILFATDLVSRGLDIKNIDCVVNFDLPRSPFDYIHRIGRTGRAKKKGLAISFVSYEDEAHFKIIEKKSKIKLQREEILGFELKGEAPKKVKGLPPVKGKKKSKKDKLRELALKEGK